MLCCSLTCVGCNGQFVSETVSETLLLTPCAAVYVSLCDANVDVGSTVHANDCCPGPHNSIQFISPHMLRILFIERFALSDKRRKYQFFIFFLSLQIYLCIVWAWGFLQFFPQMTAAIRCWYDRWNSLAFGRRLKWNWMKRFFFHLITPIWLEATKWAYFRLLQSLWPRRRNWKIDCGIAIDERRPFDEQLATDGTRTPFALMKSSSMPTPTPMPTSTVEWRCGGGR